VLVSRSGLVTVTGGKWTTYRAMAEDVLDTCMQKALLGRKPGRRATDEITVFDSTGLAVQDIAIAAAVAERATAAPALARSLGGD
jgi:glycerol-3-phosphate dehydrogenase